MKTIYIIFSLYVAGCMACGGMYEANPAPSVDTAAILKAKIDTAAILKATATPARLTDTELKQIKTITDPINKLLSSQGATITSLTNTTAAQTKLIAGLQTRLDAQDALIKRYTLWYGADFGRKVDTLIIPAIPLMQADINDLKRRIKP